MYILAFHWILCLYLTPLLIIDSVWHFSFPWSWSFYILLKINYSFLVFIRDIASEPALSPCLSKSASLTYLSVYDSRDSVSESTLSPSPLSSLTYVHRCIGYRNPNWHSLPNPVRLTNLSVYDKRDVSSVSQPQLTESDQVRETDVSKCLWQQRWRFWTHTLPVVPLLTHTCT